MLKLRPEQVRTLNEAAEKELEDRMVQHVERVFPDKFRKMCVRDDEPVRQQIRQGMGKAARYKIALERDLMLFIDLMFGLGADFDHRPDTAWIREILEYQQLSGHERIQRIYRRLDAGPDA